MPAISSRRCTIARASSSPSTRHEPPPGNPSGRTYFAGGAATKSILLPQGDIGAGESWFEFFTALEDSYRVVAPTHVFGPGQGGAIPQAAAACAGAASAGEVHRDGAGGASTSIKSLLATDARELESGEREFWTDHFTETARCSHRSAMERDFRELWTRPTPVFCCDADTLATPQSTDKPALPASRRNRAPLPGRGPFAIFTRADFYVMRIRLFCGA